MNDLNGREDSEAKKEGTEVSEEKKKEELLESEKPQRTIASKFWAYLSILIFITVIFMTFYAVWTGINLISKARVDKAALLTTITNTIVELNAPEILNGDYENFDNLVKKMMGQNVLVYTVVINNEGIIEYSTRESDVGKTVTNSHFLETIRILEPIPQSEKTWWEIYADSLLFTKLNFPIFRNAVILADGKKVLIYTYLGTISEVANIYRGYIALAVTFIFCGFLSSIFLARMVTKPIKELYHGSKRLSQKDLSFRIPVDTDDEIGKLAESFNKMAEELEQSYTYLEDKVQERTKELEQKKEEVEKKNLEIEEAYQELKAAQVQLVHSEKMSSLGQLVAGVAHELNNPINFIYGNMEHLKNYSHDMKTLIDKYETCIASLKEEERQDIEDFKEEIDYEYLLEDLDDLLDSCKEGAERTRQIVLDLRNFSRLDEANLKDVNIHEGLDSTLNILHNKYKNRVDVIKDYDESIPAVTCFAGQLNQVFMNILANAAQAIKGKGTVKITTRKDGDYAKISFTDNGVGIDPEHLSRIFDPFFTTKDIGEGTGLGLSVSYGIIEKHNGTISVESKVGEGTTFTIRIPIKWKKDIIKKNRQTADELNEEKKQKSQNSDGSEEE
jgi:signal transduction histidine kinase